MVQQHPDRFRVTGISAGGGNLALLAQQAVALRVEAVGVAAGDRQDVLAALGQAAREAGVHGFAPDVLIGPEANTRLAGSGADVVLNGITGSIGLLPTLAALKAGSTLALANKESLIVGGALVKDAAAPGQIVPVDSEHSAIAQCLRGGSRRGGTPSRGHRERRTVPRPEPGGPRAGHRHRGAGPPQLRHGARHHDELGHAGEQGARGDRGAPALRHPLRPDRRRGAPAADGPLDGGVHDGSTMAQASPPSMLIPIALGLGWPDRVPDAAPGVRLDDRLDVGVLPARRRGVPLGRPRTARGAGGRRRTRRCSTRPTRSAWRRSWPAPSRSSRSSTRSRGWSHEWAEAGQPGNDSGELTVESVLQAEAWARTRARSVLGLAGAVGRETGKP